MADKKDKYPDNIPGKYYVDRECIFCNVCVDRIAKSHNIKISKTKLFVFITYTERSEGQKL